MRAMKLVISAALTLAMLLLQSAAALPQEDNAAAWKKLVREDSDETQPVFPIQFIRRLGDDIVTESDGFKIVDPNKPTLEAFAVPNIVSIKLVSEDESKHKTFAFGTNSKGCVIERRDADGWHSITVPPAVSAKRNKWKMLSEGGDLAFIASDECIYLHNGVWSKAKIPKNAVTGEISNTLVLKAGKIYSGFDLGEWGGRISEIDATTGATREIFKDSMYAVRDLKFGPDGKLWFVCGISHMGFETAALYSYDGKLHCHSEVQGMQNSPKNKKQVNWDLGATSFRGMLFAKDGSLLVVTADYGIMKYSNEKWSRLTPNWHLAPVCGIAETKSGLIVLPCWHRGIVFVAPANESYKFILSNSSSH